MRSHLHMQSSHVCWRFHLNIVNLFIDWPCGFGTWLLCICKLDLICIPRTFSTWGYSPQRLLCGLSLPSLCSLSFPLPPSLGSLSFPLPLSQGPLSFPCFPTSFTTHSPWALCTLPEPSLLPLPQSLEPLSYTSLATLLGASLIALPPLVTHGFSKRERLVIFPSKLQKYHGQNLYLVF